MARTFKQVEERYRDAGLEVHAVDQMMAILRDRDHLIVKNMDGGVMEVVAKLEEDQYVIALGLG